VLNVIDQSKSDPVMRKLTPILLTWLLCGANTFATEGVANESHDKVADTGACRKLAAVESKTRIPKNALFENIGETNSIVIRLDISNDEGKTWRPGGSSYLHRHRN